MNGPLRFEQIDPQSPVKLDGVLKEWPPTYPAKADHDSGSSFAVSLQYDDQRIYVGGVITDASPSRTKKMADNEDHVTFSLAFPSRGSARRVRRGHFSRCSW